MKVRKSLLRAIGSRSYRDNKDGAAAVEFALIAPVFVGLLAIAVDFSLFLLQRGEMAAAINTAVRYYIAGGTDRQDARDLAEAAWTSKPENGAIMVVEEHFCNGTPVAAGTLCQPGNVPTDVVPRIVATATFTGLFGSRDLMLEDGIKVR